MQCQDRCFRVQVEYGRWQAPYARIPARAFAVRQCSDGATAPVSSSRRVPIAPHEAKAASMFRGRLREPDLREEGKCAVGASATNSSGRESCSEDRRAFLRAPAATAFRTARKLDLGHAVQLRALIRTGLSALQNAPLTIPQSGPQRSDTNAATQTQRHKRSDTQEVSAPIGIVCLPRGDLCRLAAHFRSFAEHPSDPIHPDWGPRVHDRNLAAPPNRWKNAVHPSSVSRRAQAADGLSWPPAARPCRCAARRTPATG